MSGTPIANGDEAKCFYAPTQVPGNHTVDVVRAGGGREFQRLWPGLVKPSYLCADCRGRRRGGVAKRPSTFKPLHGRPLLSEEDSQRV